MQRVDTDRDYERASRAQPAWSRRDRRVERAQMPWLGRKPEGRWSLHAAYLEAKRSQLGVEHDRLQAAQESLLWTSRKQLSGAKQAVSGIFLLLPTRRYEGETWRVASRAGNTRLTACLAPLNSLRDGHSSRLSCAA